MSIWEGVIKQINCVVGGEEGMFVAKAYNDGSLPVFLMDSIDGD